MIWVGFLCSVLLAVCSVFLSSLTKKVVGKLMKATCQRHIESCRPAGVDAPDVPKLGLEPDS